MDYFNVIDRELLPTLHDRHISHINVYLEMLTFSE
jgi:hypothetical protein